MFGARVTQNGNPARFAKDSTKLVFGRDCVKPVQGRGRHDKIHTVIGNRRGFGGGIDAGKTSMVTQGMLGLCAHLGIGFDAKNAITIQ